MVVCVCSFYVYDGRSSNAVFNRPKHSPRSTVYVRLYTGICCKVHSTAHSPERWARSEWLNPAACGLSRNALHSKPQPVGQLELTIISWYCNDRLPQMLEWGERNITIWSSTHFYMLSRRQLLHSLPTNWYFYISLAIKTHYKKPIYFNVNHLILLY